jgi:TRAP-type C4-dicarboxylate transport system substrate-binding protein
MNLSVRATALAAASTLALTAGNFVAHAQSLRMTLGTMAVPYTPVETASNRFAEIVSEMSGGDISIVVNDSLLRGAQLAPAVRDGRIEIVMGVPTYLSGSEPRMGLQNLPGLVQSDADYRKILDAFWEDEMSAIWGEQFKAMPLATGMWEPNLLFSTRPIHSLADFQGAKIRVHNVETAQFIAALGASPTALDVAEVQAGLERGIIDGFITSLCYSYQQGMHRVTKYLQNYKLAPIQGWSILIGKDVWDGLTPERQEIFRAAGDQVEEELYTAHAQMVQTCLQQFKEAGADYFEADAELRAEIFSEANTQDVYAEWYRRAEEKGFAGEDFVARARAAVDE